MFLLEFLKNLGINLSDTDNVLFEVFFSTNILILCTVSMFCVINIIIYLLVIKSIDTVAEPYIQSKIINYSIVRKILNLYKEFLNILNKGVKILFIFMPKLNYKIVMV